MCSVENILFVRVFDVLGHGCHSILSPLIFFPPATEDSQGTASTIARQAGNKRYTLSRGNVTACNTEQHTIAITVDNDRQTW